MEATEGLFPVVEVPEHCRQYMTQIDGLGFERNYVSSGEIEDGLVETNIFSNPGTIVGHFVTHAPDFRYSTFGIHVGQRDRLTFYSYQKKRIVGYFIDCRRGSPSCGLRLALKFDTNAQRKLIIPCGIAHAFAHIEGVVTRNDLTLFADPNNTGWNLLNDDVVFPWTAEGITTAPNLEINSFEMPVVAATLFYQVQQEALRRQQGSAKQPQMLFKEGDSRISVDPAHNLSDAVRIPMFEEELYNCRFEVNNFKSIADRSWMIIANTPSCVMDLVIMHLESRGQHSYVYHRSQSLLHTFLDRERSPIMIELVDLRSGSSTFRRRATCSFTCDPRFHIRIPAGVAYRYSAAGQYAVRVEHEMLSEVDDQPTDLIKIRADRNIITDSEIDSFPGIKPLGSPLSPSVQQSIAFQEFERIMSIES